MTKSLITGIPGQDGSYLAEFLTSFYVEIDPRYHRPAEAPREFRRACAMGAAPIEV
jgi:hypothetical protein